MATLVCVLVLSLVVACGERGGGDEAVTGRPSIASTLYPSAIMPTSGLPQPPRRIGSCFAPKSVREHCSECRLTGWACWNGPCVRLRSCRTDENHLCPP